MRSRYTVFAAVFLIAALAPLFAPTPAEQVATSFPGWPAQFEGRPLQPLLLSSAEQRFARDFPGRLGRFSDGQREIVLRWVEQPTRRLHPAADCFRGSGYRVTPMPIEVINGRAWGRFDARRNGEHWQVREVIVDASGRAWTDASSWYWSAMREQAQRGWWSITVAASSAGAATASSRTQFLAEQ
jgi:hypothetical protein